MIKINSSEIRDKFFDEQKNKLPDTTNKILIDWLSFTSKIDSDLSVFDVLGLSHIKKHFQLIYGFQGYKQRFYFEGISIHYGHSKNQGVWVEMSGQGCRTFETYSKISFVELFKAIIYNQENEDYNVTRLDVAFDDFHKIIPLKKLSNQILDEHFVSKFEPKSYLVNMHPGRKGITCDIGSSSSNLKFRVYDKAYERGYFEEIEKNGFSWTRWEIQMRDDRAYNFMKLSLDSDVGQIFRGVILKYFRVVDVNKSDSNKRRWNTSKWYLKFIGDVENISLFTPCKSDYNLYKCERYVYTQAGNAVDTLIQIKGVDNFIAELRASKSETTPKYKELLNTYNASHDIEEHGANILNYLKEHNLE